MNASLAVDSPQHHQYDRPLISPTPNRSYGCYSSLAIVIDSPRVRLPVA
ncbi:MAG: hypothetical protein KME45_31645 [Stenomitos rutilans HA7619-LM2]|nr:hypothetical protein [Stenomitos rutilans HA7619-LM2]